MSQANLTALVIGGSKNVGFYSAIRLLADGATVTFLLRSPSVFDEDQVVQGHIKSGRARVLKGDALVIDDVKRAWDEAAKGSHTGVDLLLFTVGGAPKFQITKGFTISPPNLVTQAFLNVLCTLPAHRPKIIVLSSNGLTRTSHATLPLPLKPLYSYLLTGPHNDKEGVERSIAYCAGWNRDVAEPGEDIMGLGDWRKREGLVEPGTLDQVVIIRPALFTDSACEADKKGSSAYRVKDAKDGELKGAWSISRKDVAHFVVEGVVKNWDEYKNKGLVIAY